MAKFCEIIPKIVWPVAKSVVNSQKFSKKIATFLHSENLSYLDRPRCFGNESSSNPNPSEATKPSNTNQAAAAAAPRFRLEVISKDRLPSDIVDKINSLGVNYKRITLNLGDLSLEEVKTSKKDEVVVKVTTPSVHKKSFSYWWKKFKKPGEARKAIYRRLLFLGTACFAVALHEKGIL